MPLQLPSMPVKTQTLIFFVRANRQLQICQFCYNNIKTTMNGLCPACRRPYDDKNVRWEAPSAEEYACYLL